MNGTKNALFFSREVQLIAVLLLICESDMSDMRLIMIDLMCQLGKHLYLYFS